MFGKGVGLLGGWEPWDGVYLNKRVGAHKGSGLRHTQTPDPSGLLEAAQIRRWPRPHLFLGSRDLGGVWVGKEEGLNQARGASVLKVHRPRETLVAFDRLPRPLSAPSNQEAG